jgi:hypothetical protein
MTQYANKVKNGYVVGHSATEAEFATPGVPVLSINGRVDNNW